jgi:sporulation protein YlmC with PRC-barrel domain
MAEDKLVSDEVIDITAIKGNRVLAPNGDNIGEIDSLYIHPRTLQLHGLKVSKGIFKTDYYVSRGNIEYITKDAAMLRVTPVEEFKGLVVFDAEGKRVGKVKEIRTHGRSNEIDKVVIDRGMIRKDLVVDMEEIAGIGRSVLLKISVS